MRGRGGRGGGKGVWEENEGEGRGGEGRGGQGREEGVMYKALFTHSP